MSLPFRRRLTVSLLGFSLCVVACGGDDSSTAAAVSGAPCADNCVTIVADNVLFKTKEVSAKAGTVTIVLDNEEPAVVVHNITLQTPAGNKKVVETNGHKKVSATIELAAGDYPYVCTIPGHGAMKGTLKVS
jgi:plastocyanin